MTQTTLEQPAADRPRWFLAAPTWIRAGAAETGGALSMVEQVLPAGFASPWHLHSDEDESFYVIEGAMEVNVDGQVARLGAGGYGFGPRGVPHGFRIVGAGPARILLVTGGGASPASSRRRARPARPRPMARPTSRRWSRPRSETGSPSSGRCPTERVRSS